MTTIIDWGKGVLSLDNVAIVVVVLLVGALLSSFRPRWGRRWIVAATVAYWFVSTPFGSSLLVGPIARSFHSIQDPREAASAAAIVVLGGGTNNVTARSDVIARPSDTTALRTLEAVRVFRLLDGRPLVVASGGTPHAGQRTPEGRVIADALVALGVPIDHIFLEDVSLTTHDQALIVTRLLASRGIHRFVLVTSPTHMWRSVAVFRAQQADVIPSPSPLSSDEIAPPPFFVPNNDSLRLSDEALYDYLGTVYYWVRGWFRPVHAPKTR